MSFMRFKDPFNTEARTSAIFNFLLFYRLARPFEAQLM